MGVGITYMGTKRVLAPAVGEVIRDAQKGVMLDAFSGMCSVGEMVGDSRQVWSNDAQVFASKVAQALFTSRDSPLSPLSCGDIHYERFKSHQDLLSNYFQKSLAAEARLLESISFGAFKRRMAGFKQALASDVSGCRMRSPHLFATIYSGSFFGIKQAIDIDAVIASMNAAKSERKISVDELRWEMIALGRALLKVANSTGHFAQYLKPKLETYQRYIALRKRSLWEEWISSLAVAVPVGSPEWRRGNKAFNNDSLKLMPYLARNKAEMGVIYADPPYTDDQYSRFYHVLETLCLYDYPKVAGAGLYRPSRFVTPFSLKSKAPDALLKFIKLSSQTGADLVLSYPTNGLAHEAGANVRAMLKKHFRRVELCHSVSHKHSTFGASKGSAKTEATELIYLARSA